MDIQNLSDIQSESGVIGTLIFHPEFILHTDYLKANHFYGVDNGCIYWAINELFKEGITNIDAYNLSNKLQSNAAVSKAIDKYNLPSVNEFVELYKETARHTIEEYKMLADNVVTYAFKRELIKTLSELEGECKRADTDLEKLNNEVYGKLDALTQRFISSTDVHTLGEEIDDIWGEILNRRTDDGVYGMPSKYPSLNEYFSYENGELVIIQAYYKQGKSVFLMNEVVHKLQNGVPVLVCDSEMPTRLYTERLLSHVSGVEIKKIKNGNYTAEEEARINESLKWIKAQPLVHIYDPHMSMEKLFSICKILKRKIGLEFVCYDYLKSNESTSSENYNALGAMCDFLKNNIAGELDLAVLAACQLNRNGEVADSIKINRYLSVGIKWGYKSADQIARDGIECGNAYAKVYVNRLGKQMLEDDDDDYVDFLFDGSRATIIEAQPHNTTSEF